MSVARLITKNFRNLSHATLNLHPQLNLLIGDNGSGKSSLLEAVFFLGHGKSFRTTKAEHMTNFDEHQFVVSAKDLDNLQLGISKNFASGKTTIKINGQNQQRLSVLAQQIAVQIVTPESFKLFFGGPKERRRFVDLGMFHVKPNFSKQWNEFSKVLKQRNACIKNNLDSSTLIYWTDIFCHQSLVVARLREQYIDNIQGELNFFLNKLLPELSGNVTMSYYQGWAQKKNLLNLLRSNKEKEALMGYSLYGAHRFDVKFLLGKQPLESQLSRGQQKLFLLALTFAQTKLIAKVKRVKPILMIDDIGAELDISSRSKLSDIMSSLDCQVIMTAIDCTVLTPFIELNTVIGSKYCEKKYKLFHVKHGVVSEI